MPKTPKLTREQKQALKTAKRAQRRETWSNFKQAFTLTKQNDPRFIPYLVLASGFGAAAGYLILWAVTGSAIVPIVAAVLVGVLAALIVFSLRARKSMYTQAEGQLGAAGWVLTNQLRGDWRVSQAVAGTQQMDAVHRVIGRPGVILVGEGQPQRVRTLIAQEKKRISRLTGDTPIYDVVVGIGEDEVRLGKLGRHLLKLPSNLAKDEVNALDKRLAAVTGQRMPIPKGPMPAGAKMRNVQRAVRRRS